MNDLQEEIERKRISATNDLDLKTVQLDLQERNKVRYLILYEQTTIVHSSPYSSHHRY